MTSLPPLALYIHLPWCLKKCPYCDFNSHVNNKALPEEEYLQCLFKDFETHLETLQNRKFSSVFFGGGTPSLFSAKAIETCLHYFLKQNHFHENIEITLEMNPGTYEHGKIEDYVSAGVNRISLGVQSFNDKHLKQLGRIHHAKESQQALETLQTLCNANTLRSFNVDIMHGLPKQTEQEALEDIQQAIKFQPPHLSWYQLTLEPNTVFYKKKPNLPSEDTCFEIEIKGKQLLRTSGFHQYEISAYAKPGHMCQHNLHYWQYHDYLGIGAGAHSKITLCDQHQMIRFSNKKNPKIYMDKTIDFIESHQVLSEDEILFEFCLNHLRLNEAVSFTDFEKKTGLPASKLKHLLLQAEKLELVEMNNNAFNKTSLGQQYTDNLLALFLPTTKKGIH